MDFSCSDLRGLEILVFIFSPTLSIISLLLRTIIVYVPLKRKKEKVYIIYVHPFLDYIQLYICIIYSIEMKFNVSLWVLQVRSSLALCNSVF